MADESDDDLYGDESATQQKKDVKKAEDNSSGDEPMDEESGDDDDDSDSDIDIIIEKAPAPAKPTATHQSQESKAIKIEAPPRSSTPSQHPQKPAPTTGGAVPQLSASALSGTAFPAQRTSTIDVNGNPIYPPQGKEILSVDIDADLAEEQKIWRRPGEDQSDYFNYGFDEFTWELYRQRQVAMANTLQGQKNDMAQMQAMMGGGPMPGMPGMGGVPPQGNGAPGGAPPSGPGGGGAGAGAAGAMGPGGMNEQQMQMMMQEMMAQGMDPSQMDFASFMQMAGQGMGGFPGGPGGQQGGGFQQGHQGGGGRGGRGGRGRGW